MSKREKEEIKLPERWHCFLVPAVLPFLIGVLVLQLFAPAAPLDLLEPIPNETEEFMSGFVQMGDRIIYAAAITLQVAVSIAVLGLFWGYFRQLDAALRKAANRMLLVTVVIALVAVLIMRLSYSAAYELTFELNRHFFLRAEGLPQEFGEGGYLLGQSRIFYSGLIPFTMGVTVVAFGTALMAAMSTSGRMADEECWREAAKQRLKCLQTCFRASSLVLVTSAIAMLLFLQLPSQTIADAEATKSLSRFALGLTTFWGLVMTLTLFAVFSVPYLSLRRECDCHQQRVETDQSFDDWFSTQKQFNLKRDLTNVATMLAPVLVGPAGSLIQKILGG